MGSPLSEHLDAVIAASVRDNAVLLDYPNAATVKCGAAKGRMGDGGMFSRASEVEDIWRPSRGPRGRDESANGEEVELTRCCAITFDCPAEVVHDVWFRKHFQRHRWDTRTVADSRPLDHPPSMDGGQGDKGSDGNGNGNDHDEDSNTLLVWLRSTPKPLISTRDFIYAYRCVDVSADGKTRLYAGASLDPHIVAEHAGLAVPEAATGSANTAGSVRAWLQGCGRVEVLGPRSCRMTYCLRVQPKGDIPKFVVQAVANETVYTLYDLRKQCEAVYARRLNRRNMDEGRRRKKKRKKKKKKKMLKQNKVLSRLGGGGGSNGGSSSGSSSLLKKSSSRIRRAAIPRARL